MKLICLKNRGLKSSYPFNKPNQEIFDTLKILAFGSVENYRNYFNCFKRQTRRNEEGKTFGQIKREILWELVEFYPGGKDAYIKDRNTHPRKAFYKRSREDGSYQERLFKERLRRYSDEEYRLKRLEGQRISRR